jgi:hypothetical protein
MSTFRETTKKGDGSEVVQKPPPWFEKDVDLQESDAAQKPCSIFESGNLLLEGNARSSCTSFADGFCTTTTPTTEIGRTGVWSDRHDHIAVDAGERVFFVGPATVFVGRKAVATRVKRKG